MRHFFSYLIPFSILFWTVALASDYYEQLILKPLPQSTVLASFNFRSNTTLSQFEARNFQYFPRSLGQILQHVGTRELHLRFSLGRWDAESWGARPWEGTKEGGTGVELWAWLEADTDEEASHKWLSLTNALSGLFCASLNFIDETRTTRPVMSFQPEGDHSNTTLANMQLLHGVLPREVVCTENLTPFLKLLPCKGKAGISSLLDGHKLFDASWQSMAIDIRPLCPDGQECVLQIEQTIDMVLDIERSKRPRDNPIPRPLPGHELKCNSSKPYNSGDTCFPTDYAEGQEWALDQIFGKTIKGACPLTDPEVPPVCIQVPHSRDIYTTAGASEIKNPNRLSRCYQVPLESDFSMILPHMSREGDHPKTDADEIVEPETPLLYAERSFTGHGYERGGVRTILTNPSPDTEVEFFYMESLPWFMKIYLHTLATHINGVPGSKSDIIEEIYYRPALDRVRGTQLELRMRIPPASTVFLTYDFEKSILRYTEYPPDANRGFDVAAAIITILPSTSPDAPLARQKTSNLRTTSLLLSLPTPDFSMPYNVIIFTSTVIALAFGGLYNILIRRFVGADEGAEANAGGLKNKIIAAVAKLAGQLKGAKGKVD
ncbi:Gpi16 subunit, GPI transamidase component [Daldinia decipiens]|uniref:Gpi16 subunit, GPI transamidase component n=1 Tax=Daldinia decipiens TaxID=326647 RepID=UPI0020C2AA78|nr:Gpi16 subunit, GPI transamidase component [Daldinia decipiens]KAI1656433.1 Gpi16 subunit, GPI transamidase component [Daldinia decipiens]